MVPKKPFVSLILVLPQLSGPPVLPTPLLRTGALGPPGTRAPAPLQPQCAALPTITANPTHYRPPYYRPPYCRLHATPDSRQDLDSKPSRSPRSIPYFPGLDPGSLPHLPPPSSPLPASQPAFSATTISGIPQDCSAPFDCSTPPLILDSRMTTKDH